MKDLQSIRRINGTAPDWCHKPITYRVDQGYCYVNLDGSLSPCNWSNKAEVDDAQIATAEKV